MLSKKTNITTLSIILIIKTHSNIITEARNEATDNKLARNYVSQ